MNIKTGEIYENPEGLTLGRLAAKLGVPESHLKEMTLPPTVRQQRRKIVGPYEPCPCGSGKKFKWCCFR